MNIYIVEKETKDVIAGPIVTNHSLCFDDACELAGLEWRVFPDVQEDGWYQDDILWDESVAEFILLLKRRRMPWLIQLLLLIAYRASPES